MEYLILYAIVAVILACLGVLELVLPAVRTLQDEGVENDVTENPTLILAIAFIILIIMAPLVIMHLRTHETTILSRNALTQSLR